MEIDEAALALDDCIEARTASNHPFNKWELDFIDSVDTQLRERGHLTEKQIETLEIIWEKI